MVAVEVDMPDYLSFLKGRHKAFIACRYKGGFRISELAQRRANKRCSIKGLEAISKII
jgi:hypothetical protein